MIGQSQECDNYQQKLSRIQSSLFQQVNAPNLSLFNMFFLIQQVCATYPVTIDPNVEGSFDAKGWAMHGSWGFGKHLPNDRRFGLVICRENPLRISRKLLGSYDVQKQPHPGMTGQPKKKSCSNYNPTFLFGNSQNFLDIDKFCWGYGRWAGKSSVQRS